MFIVFGRRQNGSGEKMNDENRIFQVTSMVELCYFTLVLRIHVMKCAVRNWQRLVQSKERERERKTRSNNNSITICLAQYQQEHRINIRTVYERCTICLDWCCCCFCGIAVAATSSFFYCFFFFFFLGLCFYCHFIFY